MTVKDGISAAVLALGTAQLGKPASEPHPDESWPGATVARRVSWAPTYACAPTKEELWGRVKSDWLAVCASCT